MCMTHPDREKISLVESWQLCYSLDQRFYSRRIEYVLNFFTISRNWWSQINLCQCCTNTYFWNTEIMKVRLNNLGETFWLDSDDKPTTLTLLLHIFMDYIGLQKMYKFNQFCLRKSIICSLECRLFMNMYKEAKQQVTFSGHLCFEEQHRTPPSSAGFYI